MFAVLPRLGERHWFRVQWTVNFIAQVCKSSLINAVATSLVRVRCGCRLLDEYARGMVVVAATPRQSRYILAPSYRLRISAGEEAGTLLNWFCLLSDFFCSCTHPTSTSQETVFRVMWHSPYANFNTGGDLKFCCRLLLVSNTFFFSKRLNG